MFLILKRLRRKLLEQSKIKSYLLYAFGEIILVVIGILIALQIGDWNQARKGRQQERIYLESFRQDLIANQEELDRIIFKSDSVSLICDQILKIASGEKSNVDELTISNLLVGTFGFTIFMTSEGTIDDIIGSGKLDIIRNDTIRTAVASWEADLKMIRGIEQITRETWNELLHHYNNTYDGWKHFESRGKTPLSNASQIIRDDKLMNFIGAQKMNTTMLNLMYREHDQSLEKLIGVVDRELSN